MYVAVCPELDVVSQGPTVESALDNLKEAVELFIEEMGMPDDITEKDTIIARFEVCEHRKTNRAIGT
ncbi:MAG: type II toxin-antitoxin system HicB family antitoxin [DPANN group archaeon]|nr:type II toxin-antitoxin system HicB family antitoxin [DPANN group archaeon]